ncbi:MAG: type II secretion system protein GspC [Proteobacteria bacterium]|nr:type II secretion system protein GspC [Pseudomonadota bacterium]
MLASLSSADHARLSRLAALAVCALAALVCLWLIVRLAWLLVPQGDDNAAPTPAAGVPAPAPLQSVAKWHLFGNPQTIAVLQQMRNAPATALKLTLRGTLAMDDAHDGIAMIQDEHGGERAYKVGETVDGGAKLAAVYTDHVVLDHEGVAETLSLPQAAAAAPPSAGQAAPAAPGSGRSASIPPNFAPPQLGASLDWNAAQAKLRVDPAQLAKQVHVEPVFENGKIAGARLSGGGDVAKLMNQAGLKPTDLITAINGQTLSNVSNPQQFMDNLAGAGSVSVTVLRDGKPATLTINLR